jgi:hypothetical protein
MVLLKQRKLNRGEDLSIIRRSEPLSKDPKLPSFLDAMT